MQLLAAVESLADDPCLARVAADQVRKLVAVRGQKRSALAEGLQLDLPNAPRQANACEPSRISCSVPSAS